MVKEARLRRFREHGQMAGVNGRQAKKLQIRMTIQEGPANSNILQVWEYILIESSLTLRVFRKLLPCQTHLRILILAESDVYSVNLQHSDELVQG